MVFKTSGRQLLTLYLGRNAASGKLSNGALPGGCTVAAGVDIFSASPNALPFQPSHRGQHGEVWGYFAGEQAAASIQPAPGGCWVRYGKEKPYVMDFKTFAYRSRFAFHVTRVEDDGTVMWAPTRWMMKEYRLHKGSRVCRVKKLECPDANMDFVIRKVFTKPTVPAPPPALSDVVVPGVGRRLPSSQAQPAKVPVKAGVLAVRKDSSKMKPNLKPMKVVPPPYARSEGGGALQQGGSSLPPRSARPPRPPMVVAKPVAPPPPAQAIATLVTPAPPIQVIAKPVGPPPPPKVVARPVALLPQPEAIATPVVPPPPDQAIATLVAPTTPIEVIAKPVDPPPPKIVATPVTLLPQPEAIATPVVPPPTPRVIATPVVSTPPPARSSQDEANSSRAQPDNPNANMELAVLPTPPAVGRRKIKVPCGLQILAEYLGPKAVLSKLPTSATPGLVTEGVDVFAVSPDALPFPPSHRKQNGEVWGYFFAPKRTTSMRLAHGGCWMQYGGEKKYPMINGEVVAFHRRFAFHAARVDGDGMVGWKQTRWLMKEYRMNKASPSVRKAKKRPGTNTDIVVLKVFTKPMVPPPPPPALFSEAAGCSVAGGPSAIVRTRDPAAPLPVVHRPLPPPPLPPAWSP